MRISAILLACAWLFGCSGLDAFKPYIIDITDPAALARDKTECMASAKAYHEGISFEAIGTAATKGVSSNAAGAAVSPLAPVLGGLGNASTELLNEIGALNDKQCRVYLRCLDHRGERSHAYSVIDPTL